MPPSSIEVPRPDMSMDPDVWASVVGPYAMMSATKAMAHQRSRQYLCRQTQLGSASNLYESQPRLGRPTQHVQIAARGGPALRRSGLETESGESPEGVHRDTTNRAMLAISTTPHLPLLSE